MAFFVGSEARFHRFMLLLLLFSPVQATIYICAYDNVGTSYCPNSYEEVKYNSLITKIKDLFDSNPSETDLYVYYGGSESYQYNSYEFNFPDKTITFKVPGALPGTATLYGSWNLINKTNVIIENDIEFKPNYLEFDISYIRSNVHCPTLQRQYPAPSTSHSTNIYFRINYVEPSGSQDREILLLSYFTSYTFTINYRNNPTCFYGYSNYYFRFSVNNDKSTSMNIKFREEYDNNFCISNNFDCRYFITDNFADIANILEKKSNPTNCNIYPEIDFNLQEINDIKAQAITSITIKNDASTTITVGGQINIYKSCQFTFNGNFNLKNLVIKANIFIKSNAIMYPTISYTVSQSYVPKVRLNFHLESGGSYSYPGDYQVCSSQYAPNYVLDNTNSLYIYDSYYIFSIYTNSDGSSYSGFSVKSTTDNKFCLTSETDYADCGDYIAAQSIPGIQTDLVTHGSITTSIEIKLVGMINFDIMEYISNSLIKTYSFTGAIARGDINIPNDWTVSFSLSSSTILTIHITAEVGQSAIATPEITRATQGNYNLKLSATFDSGITINDNFLALTERLSFTPNNVYTDSTTFKEIDGKLISLTVDGNNLKIIETKNEFCIRKNDLNECPSGILYTSLTDALAQIDETEENVNIYFTDQEYEFEQLTFTNNKHTYNFKTNSGVILKGHVVVPSKAKFVFDQIVEVINVEFEVNVEFKANEDPLVGSITSKSQALQYGIKLNIIGEPPYPFYQKFQIYSTSVTGYNRMENYFTNSFPYKIKYSTGEKYFHVHDITGTKNYQTASIEIRSGATNKFCVYYDSVSECSSYDGIPVINNDFESVFNSYLEPSTNKNTDVEIQIATNSYLNSDLDIPNINFVFSTNIESEFSLSRDVVVNPKSRYTFGTNIEPRLIYTINVPDFINGKYEVGFVKSNNVQTVTYQFNTTNNELHCFPDMPSQEIGEFESQPSSTSIASLSNATYSASVQSQYEEKKLSISISISFNSNCYCVYKASSSICSKFNEANRVSIDQLNSLIEGFKSNSMYIYFESNIEPQITESLTSKDSRLIITLFSLDDSRDIVMKGTLVVTPGLYFIFPLSYDISGLSITIVYDHTLTTNSYGAISLSKPELKDFDIKLHSLDALNKYLSGILPIISSSSSGILDVLYDKLKKEYNATNEAGQMLNVILTYNSDIDMNPQIIEPNILCLYPHTKYNSNTISSCASQKALMMLPSELNDYIFTDDTTIYLYDSITLNSVVLKEPKNDVNITFKTLTNTEYLTGELSVSPGFHLYFDNYVKLYRDSLILLKINMSIDLNNPEKYSDIKLIRYDYLPKLNVHFSNIPTTTKEFEPFKLIEEGISLPSTLTLEPYNFEYETNKMYGFSFYSDSGLFVRVSNGKSDGICLYESDDYCESYFSNKYYLKLSKSDLNLNPNLLSVSNEYHRENELTIFITGDPLPGTIYLHKGKTLITTKQGNSEFSLSHNFYLYDGSKITFDETIDCSGYTQYIKINIDILSFSKNESWVIVRPNNFYINIEFIFPAYNNEFFMTKSLLLIESTTSVYHQSNSYVNINKQYEAVGSTTRYYFEFSYKYDNSFCIYETDSSLCPKGISKYTVSKFPYDSISSNKYVAFVTESISMNHYFSSSNKHKIWFYVSPLQEKNITISGQLELNQIIEVKDDRLNIDTLYVTFGQYGSINVNGYPPTFVTIKSPSEKTYVKFTRYLEYFVDIYGNYQKASNQEDEKTIKYVDEYYVNEDKKESELTLQKRIINYNDTICIYKESKSECNEYNLPVYADIFSENYVNNMDHNYKFTDYVAVYLADNIEVNNFVVPMVSEVELFSKNQSFSGNLIVKSITRLVAHNETVKNAQVHLIDVYEACARIEFPESSNVNKVIIDQIYESSTFEDGITKSSETMIKYGSLVPFDIQVEQHHEVSDYLFKVHSDIKHVGNSVQIDRTVERISYNELVYYDPGTRPRNFQMLEKSSKKGSDFTYMPIKITDLPLGGNFMLRLDLNEFKDCDHLIIQSDKKTQIILHGSNLSFLTKLKSITLNNVELDVYYPGVATNALNLKQLKVYMTGVDFTKRGDDYLKHATFETPPNVTNEINKETIDTSELDSNKDYIVKEENVEFTDTEGKKVNLIIPESNNNNKFTLTINSAVKSETNIVITSNSAPVQFNLVGSSNNVLPIGDSKIKDIKIVSDASSVKIPFFNINVNTTLETDTETDIPNLTLNGDFIVNIGSSFVQSKYVKVETSSKIQNVDFLDTLDVYDSHLSTINCYYSPSLEISFIRARESTSRIEVARGDAILAKRINVVFQARPKLSAVPGNSTQVIIDGFQEYDNQCASLVNKVVFEPATDSVTGKEFIAKCINDETALIWQAGHDIIEGSKETKKPGLGGGSIAGIVIGVILVIVIVVIVVLVLKVRKSKHREDSDINSNLDSNNEEPETIERDTLDPITTGKNVLNDTENPADEHSSSSSSKEEKEEEKEENQDDHPADQE